VRKLTGEVGRAAHEVGDVVAEIRRALEAAVSTMATGESMVRDVGGVAAEADGALSQRLTGVSSLASLVDDTAVTSARQAAAMGVLAATMHQMQDLSTASATESAAAAQVATLQTSGAKALAVAARQLAELPSGCVRPSPVSRWPGTATVPCSPPSRVVPSHSPRRTGGSRRGLSVIPGPFSKWMEREQPVPVRGD